MNVSSNNPTPIIKQISKTKNIWIDRLLSSKMFFNNHKEIYDEALT